MSDAESARAHGILVIDDDEDTREGLSELLRERGYQVATAADAREGLLRLRSLQSHAIDLVVLDLQRPMGDGVAFRRAQLSDSVLASIPVIAVDTGWESDRMAPSLCASACVSKPFELPAFFATVASFCAPPRQGAREAATTNG